MWSWKKKGEKTAEKTALVGDHKHVCLRNGTHKPQYCAFFSAGTKDYERAHTIHECKYSLATPREILIVTTHSHRYSYRKRYPPERYSSLFPSLGQGWLRFGGDHPPKTSHSRRFWVDSECHRGSFCQGHYDISIPAIGRILTPRGTKTLVPESTRSWPGFLDCPTLDQFKNGLWRPC